MAHEIDAGHGPRGPAPRRAAADAAVVVVGRLVVALQRHRRRGAGAQDDACSAGCRRLFVVALCIPEAFDDGAGGLDGPLVLALAYFMVRAMHFLLFWLVAREDADLRRSARPVRPDRGRQQHRAGGRLADRGGHPDRCSGRWRSSPTTSAPGSAARPGWRLPSPGHFSERHGLIIIIALGESIVAIGVGVAELPITWPILVAAALGLVLASAMWWAYFDVSALVGERALADEPVETRARLARTAFTFAHMPMVVAIVITALGLKKVLEYVGDTDAPRPRRPAQGRRPRGAGRRRRRLPARARRLQVGGRPRAQPGAARRRCVLLAAWAAMARCPRSASSEWSPASSSWPSSSRRSSSPSDGARSATPTCTTSRARRRGRPRHGRVDPRLPARRPRPRRRGHRAGGRPASGRRRHLAPAHGPAGAATGWASSTTCARRRATVAARRHPHLGRSVAPRDRRTTTYPGEVPALGVHRGTLFTLLHAAVVARGVPVELGVPVTGVRPVPGGLAVETAQRRPRDLRPGRRLRRQPVAGPAQHERDGPRPRLRVRRALGDRRRPRTSSPPTASSSACAAPATTSACCRPAAAGPRCSGRSAPATWPPCRPAASTPGATQAAAAGPRVRAAARPRRPPAAGDVPRRRRAHAVPRSPPPGAAVLVGDAAHAMSPQLGTGTSLALADAWTLHHALATQPDARARARGVRRGPRRARALVPVVDPADDAGLPERPDAAGLAARRARAEGHAGCRG